MFLLKNKKKTWKCFYNNYGSGESATSSQAGRCEAWAWNWSQLPVLMMEIGRLYDHPPGSVIRRQTTMEDRQAATLMNWKSQL